MTAQMIKKKECRAKLTAARSLRKAPASASNTARTETARLKGVPKNLKVGSFAPSTLKQLIETTEKAAVLVEAAADWQKKLHRHEKHLLPCQEPTDVKIRTHFDVLKRICV